MSKLVRMVIALTIVAESLLGATAARAQEYSFYWDEHKSHVFPGSFCKYYNKQASDTVFTLSGGNATGLKNNDTAPHYAVCPLIRTYHAGWSQNTFNFAALNVSGTSWSVGDCDLRYTSWDGTSTWVHSSPDLTTTTGGMQYKWTNKSPAAYSTMAIYCSAVRPGEWLRKYEIKEWYPDRIGSD
jgi:hypothetical protein